MAASNFHEQAFDEGTQTKLRLFELYAREWLPVFLCIGEPWLRTVHVFDFFSGPGKDAAGTYGSPLKILKQVKEFQAQATYNGVKVVAHFFDDDAEKIEKLVANVTAENLQMENVEYDIRPLSFAEAFKEAANILPSSTAAKLVLIDQFGVDQVTESVFKTLVVAPQCDFLFFLSSSILHRFRDHPAIEQKIVRPDDYFHVHRAALDYYRGLLPTGKKYYLAPFSIKKGSNIYGVIFGSAHPRGIDKFLQVAWKNDEISGEANFDIDRDNIERHELLLPLFKPKKINAFESELEKALRSKSIHHERDVIELCFQHGVKRQHAEETLTKLKAERLIDLDFRVPDVKNFWTPRKISYSSHK